MDADKAYGEKNLRAIEQECYELYWTNPGGSIPRKSCCTATYHPPQKPSKLDKHDMLGTAGEVRTNSQAMYSCGPLHIDELVLGDQRELIYNNSLLIQDVVIYLAFCSDAVQDRMNGAPNETLMQDIAWKICWERWTIETSGERGSGKSVLAARYDDDIYIIIIIIIITRIRTWRQHRFPWISLAICGWI